MGKERTKTLQVWYTGRMKRVFYVFCATVLGVLLSVLLHAGIEGAYLAALRSSGKNPHWVTVLGGGQCALPLWVVYALPIAGALFGLWCGVTWWRIIYIEHRLAFKKNSESGTDANR